MKNGLVKFCSLLLPLGAAQAAEKPNVVLIMADDLFTDIGCYGNKLIHTPNIDRLAERGVVFDRAYANYPLCGPSRNSMMTGRYAEDTGLRSLRVLLRDKIPDAVTLSQHFSNNGYAAARVGKIYHYDNPDEIGTAGHDDPASWQTAINPSGINKQIEDKIIRISHLRPAYENYNGLGAQLSWYADPVGTDEEHTDGIVATESIKLMEQYTAGKKPFFLGVGFYKPHTPFVAPKKYFDLYDPQKLPLPVIPEGYFDTLPKPAVASIQMNETWMPAQIDIPEQIAREAVRAYYATVSFLDAQVGRVIDAIDELGMADNTIIVFISDHGYHLGHHGHWQKHTLFEQADRIPMIVAAPGSAKGKRTQAMVEIVDIYRTLSELAGLPEPTWTAGQSFAAPLKNPSAAGRSSALSAIDRAGRSFTLRTADWRYTRWGKSGPEMIELYDLNSDPNEMINLVADPKYKEIIQKLDTQLTARITGAEKKPTGL
jgi:choline-sulfatase